MRGQFLIISAVVVGVVMFAIAGTISDSQSQKYPPESRLPYQLDSVREQAERVDTSEAGDRRRFRRAIGRLGYSYSVDFWGSQDCFNVTLRSESRSATVDCAG